MLGTAPQREAPDAAKYDAREDVGVNGTTEPGIGELIARRLSRRGVLGLLTAAAASASFEGDAAAREAPSGPSTLTFAELPHQLGQRDAVAEGYEIQMLIRWGDPVLADAPAFDAARLTAEGQAKQFGYNCDYIGYLPLPLGSASSERGLLVVNHEYTNTNLIFAGMGAGAAARRRAGAREVGIEIEAHGLSVIEIARSEGRWSVIPNSRFARRITGNTPIGISGPAAGSARLRTSADPTGTRVLGTLNNCAGGNTPYGTVLSGEENFNGYFGFSGEGPEGAEAVNLRRYGVSKETWYNWVTHVARFDATREPNEPNRFGWVVEIDPHDSTSVPIKRTALGRFKHEGAHSVISADGRLVVYMGDDERFEYVYKFVSRDRVNTEDRTANFGLLDNGTLCVAQFHDDGRVLWLPLVHGQGPLTAENGFNGQADVLIETRRAADLLRATPMDRPEDVEPNPVSGRVYVLLTNNIRRRPEQVNRANPRPANDHGHVIEIIPPGAGTDRVDHAGAEARWEIFLVAGKPGQDAGARYHRMTTDDGWMSCPDNCVFDSKGRIWIATDGAPTAAGIADGVYGMDTTGYGRALSRLFYQAPTGAEVCGPCFTPDDTTMFLAIQHPGEDPGSTFEQPSTRWPDFAERMPPRPSVIAITKRGGGSIG